MDSLRLEHHEGSESARSLELADARRRFVLALRILTARREQEERDREAVAQWAEILEREIRAYRRWRIRQRMRWGIGAASFLFVLWWFLSEQRGGFPWWLWWIFGGGAAVDAAAGSRQKAASELAKINDPRAVSVLAVACRDGDPDTRTVAARGLKNILPRLQARDAAHITPEGMEALIALLRMADASLGVAILKALEQVGDARAIPTVERLAESPKRRRAWAVYLDAETPQERLREAAAACLPYLRTRAEQERLRNTLLRPAQGPDSPADILLRPASAAPSTPEEQLLRPSSPEG